MRNNSVLVRYFKIFSRIDVKRSMYPAGLRKYTESYYFTLVVPVLKLQEGCSWLKEGAGGLERV
jgi:hypothetical protein